MAASHDDDGQHRQCGGGALSSTPPLPLLLRVVIILESDIPARVYGTMLINAVHMLKPHGVFLASVVDAVDFVDAFERDKDRDSSAVIYVAIGESTKLQRTIDKAFSSSSSTVSAAAVDIVAARWRRCVCVWSIELFMLGIEEYIIGTHKAAIARCLKVAPPPLRKAAALEPVFSFVSFGLEEEEASFESTWQSLLYQQQQQQGGVVWEWIIVTTNAAAAAAAEEQLQQRRSTMSPILKLQQHHILIVKVDGAMRESEKRNWVFGLCRGRYIIDLGASRTLVPGALAILLEYSNSSSSADESTNALVTCDIAAQQQQRGGGGGFSFFCKDLVYYKELDPKTASASYCTRQPRIIMHNIFLRDPDYLSYFGLIWNKEHFLRLGGYNVAIDNFPASKYELVLRALGARGGGAVHKGCHQQQTAATAHHICYPILAEAASNKISSSGNSVRDVVIRNFYADVIFNESAVAAATVAADAHGGSDGSERNGPRGLAGIGHTNMNYVYWMGEQQQHRRRHDCCRRAATTVVILCTELTPNIGAMILKSIEQQQQIAAAAPAEIEEGLLSNIFYYVLGPPALDKFMTEHLGELTSLLAATTTTATIRWHAFQDSRDPCCHDHFRMENYALRHLVTTKRYHIINL